jgi:hypothetical protein
MEQRVFGTADVFERVQREWATLQDTLAGLNEQQLTAPGPEGWSIKDHLAHLSTWEKVLLTILGGKPQHVAFDLDADAYDRIDSVDQLNAIVYERHKGRSLDEVLAESARVHADMLSAVQRLSDADLERSIADFGADRDDHRSIRAKIEGDSYAHYAEHVSWIRDVRRAVLSS